VTCGAVGLPPHVPSSIGSRSRIRSTFNNAVATKRSDFLELAEADWLDGSALKFHCLVRASRTAWPYLKASNGGIINLIGVAGRSGNLEFAFGGSVNVMRISTSMVTKREHPKCHGLHHRRLILNTRI